MAELKKKIYEVTDALKEIGLGREILYRAINEGEIARNSCTPNDPVCFPGFYAWAKTVSSLRDQLAVKGGWTCNNDQNYPTVVSADKRFAIAVASGDKGTGKAELNPSTKHPKGIKTQTVVKQNQLSLNFSGLGHKSGELERKKTVTWILLIRRADDEVFSELSLPDSMTDDGTIVGWKTRILLDPVKLDTSVPTQDDSTDDAIVVPVVRREQ